MADGKPVSPEEDQYLYDLLDSALKDFNKEQKVNEVDEKKESSAAATNEENFETLEDAWSSNIFGGTADQFREKMQNLIGNDRRKCLRPNLFEASRRYEGQLCFLKWNGGLEDFHKVQNAGKVDKKKESLAPGSDEDTFETIGDAWTKDVIKEAADQFEENLQNLIKNGPDSEVGASFKKMAQILASVASDDDKTDKDGTSTDFETVIAQALNDLSVTSETLQNEPDISEMLGQASLDDGSGPIPTMMQGILQHLLSKEILYPSLKELVDKYPEWLEGKKTSLSPNDLERFNKQLEIMRQVCCEVEKEKDDDTEDTKMKRFVMVISLMQKLQGYGELPEELVGEQTMPFPVDAEGEPGIPPLLRVMDPSLNCRLM